MLCVVWPSSRSIFTLFFNFIGSWRVTSKNMESRSMKCRMCRSLFVLLNMHEGVPQSLRTPFLLQSLHTPLWFDGWLIDWVHIACTFFPFFSKKNHLRFDFHFFSIRKMTFMPLDRLEWSSLVGLFPGSIDFQSAQTLRHTLVLNQSINHRITWGCADFEAKTGCADFETYPWRFLFSPLGMATTTTRSTRKRLRALSDACRSRWVAPTHPSTIGDIAFWHELIRGACSMWRTTTGPTAKPSAPWSCTKCIIELNGCVCVFFFLCNGFFFSFAHRSQMSDLQEVTHNVHYENFRSVRLTETVKSATR